MLNGTYGVNHYAAYLGGTGKLPPDEFKKLHINHSEPTKKRVESWEIPRGKISSQESELAANRWERVNDILRHRSSTYDRCSIYEKRVKGENDSWFF